MLPPWFMNAPEAGVPTGAITRGVALMLLYVPPPALGVGIALPLTDGNPDILDVDGAPGKSMMRLFC